MNKKRISNPRTYIKDIKEKSTFSINNIVVEHRSNNPKRDFLFVNKKQCKHIPCKASDMIEMCRELSDIVNNSIGKDKRVLVIAFAETATAIGNVVADYIDNCVCVMQTTREDAPNSVQLITFEEEHSHATTQKLLVSEKFKTEKFNDIDYILFVEDEISTGNTILNFVSAFKSIADDKKFGVASVCNWQSEENIQKFNDMGIDRFFLLSGELLNTDIKMFTPEEYKEVEMENPDIDSEFERVYMKEEVADKKPILNERLEHKSDRDLSELYSIFDRVVPFGVQTLRIVGTEEFMYMPIKLAEYAEKLGIMTICHSTTRSSIDISTKYGIKDKHRILCPYDTKRKTYIYNTQEYTDMVLIVSDTEFTEQQIQQYKKIFNTEMLKTITLYNGGNN